MLTIICALATSAAIGFLAAFLFERDAHKHTRSDLEEVKVLWNDALADAEALRAKLSRKKTPAA